VQVEKAAGVTKDAAWIAKVHEEIAQDSCSEFGVGADKILGFVMDNTAANRAAMRQ
jgi:hypothetical protein